MNEAITFRTKVHFRRGRHGRKSMASGEAPAEQSGRVPHVSKLMALAIRFEGLLRDGQVKDQAELARLGHVTRARVTQIMNLVHLAPDIQEQILLWPQIVRGKDPLHERNLRPITAVADWRKQRRMWKNIVVHSPDAHAVGGCRLAAAENHARSQESPPQGVA